MWHAEHLETIFEWDLCNQGKDWLVFRYELIYFKIGVMIDTTKVYCVNDLHLHPKSQDQEKAIICAIILLWSSPNIHSVDFVKGMNAKLFEHVLFKCVCMHARAYACVCVCLCVVRCVCVNCVFLSEYLFLSAYLCLREKLVSS